MKLLWTCLGRERSVFTRFSRLKLAAANLKRGPNPGLKLAAAYFSPKKLYVYTDVLDLFKLRPIFKPRLIFARINGPNNHQVVGIEHTGCDF